MNDILAYTLLPLIDPFDIPRLRRVNKTCANYNDKPLFREIRATRTHIRGDRIYIDDHSFDIYDRKVAVKYCAINGYKYIVRELIQRSYNMEQFIDCSAIAAQYYCCPIITSGRLTTPPFMIDMIFTGGVDYTRDSYIVDYGVIYHSCGCGVSVYNTKKLNGRRKCAHTANCTVKIQNAIDAGLIVKGDVVFLREYLCGRCIEHFTGEQVPQVCEPQSLDDVMGFTTTTSPRYRRRVKTRMHALEKNNHIVINKPLKACNNNTRLIKDFIDWYEPKPCQMIKSAINKCNLRALKYVLSLYPRHQYITKLMLDIVHYCGKYEVLQLFKCKPADRCDVFMMCGRNGDVNVVKNLRFTYIPDQDDFDDLLRGSGVTIEVLKYVLQLNPQIILPPPPYDNNHPHIAEWLTNRARESMIDERREPLA